MFMFMHRRQFRSPGFTLVELLMALAISMILSIAAFALWNHLLRMERASANSSDMWQQARIALKLLEYDIRRAGAGYGAHYRDETDLSKTYTFPGGSSWYHDQSDMKTPIASVNQSSSEYSSSFYVTYYDGELREYGGANGANWGTQAISLRFSTAEEGAGIIASVHHDFAELNAERIEAGGSAFTYDGTFLPLRTDGAIELFKEGDLIFVSSKDGISSFAIVSGAPDKSNRFLPVSFAGHFSLSEQAQGANISLFTHPYSTGNDQRGTFMYNYFVAQSDVGGQPDTDVDGNKVFSLKRHHVWNHEGALDSNDPSQTMFRGIVALEFRFGVDSNEDYEDEEVDFYAVDTDGDGVMESPVGVNNPGLRPITVRVAMLVRTTVPDPNYEQQFPIVIFPLGGDGGAALPALEYEPTDPSLKHYRYKVLTTEVPLRNMLVER